MKTGIRTVLATTSAVLALTAASALGPFLPAEASGANITAPATPTPICTAPKAHAALAARLSKDIAAALRGRAGQYAVRVEDARTGVECRVNEGHRFDSASVVKATILAALLRWHQETRTPLSQREKDLAWNMITLSDNDAATALWNELGVARIQQFLNLATMTETEPDRYGAWGLTQITARDELQLLRLLTEPNSVLTNASRAYELSLMANVVSSERWGTPAGVPRGLNVYVKNGWLPYPSLWIINSIGAFTGHGRDYKMVVLTDDNPSEGYGIDTIQKVAEVVHHDLNAGLPAAGTPLAAATVPQSQLGRPDEALPRSAR
ncbi:MAG TPA: serine hydrolase [Trebonia sp.]